MMKRMRVPCIAAVAGLVILMGCGGQPAPAEVVASPEPPTVTLTQEPSLTPTATPISYPMRLEQVGQFGGWLSGLALKGDLLFMTVGPRLAVVDVSNPYQSVIVGQSEMFPDNIQALAVMDQYVITGSSEGHIRVFDITEPTNPRLIRAIDTGAEIYQITLDGSTAYLAPSQDVLRVVDLANPAEPRLNDLPIVNGSVVRLATTGNLLITNGDQIAIIDISEPQTPSLLYSEPHSSDYNNLAVTNNTIYADSLTIDISDPSSPKHVSSDSPFSDGMLAAGDYVLSYSGRLDIHTIYPVLQIYDYSDLAHPVEAQKGISSLPEGDGLHSDNIAVNGHFVYVGGERGLEIYDISITPTNHVIYADIGVSYSVWHQISFLRTEYAEVFAGCCAAYYPGEIYIVDHYLYTFTTDSVSVWSLENPAQPTVLRTLDQGWSLSTRLQVKGGFIRTRQYGYDFIDTSNPQNLRLTEVTYGGIEGGIMAAHNNLLFVQSSDHEATQATGKQVNVLNIFDIGNPYDPRLVGSYSPIEGNLRNNYQVGGDYLSIDPIAVDGAIITLDISDPAQPKKVDIPQPTLPASVTQDDVIFRLGEQQLRIYLKTDSETPIATLSVPSSWEYRLSDQLLFLTGVTDTEPAQSVTTVVDIHDLRHPQIIATVDTLFAQVAVEGDYIYAVTNWNNLTIYRLVPK